MSIELVPLGRGSPFLRDVSRMNEESFPPFERVSIEEMMSAGEAEGNGFEAIVRDGKAVGFVLYLVLEDVCFLGFLAVSEDVRSAGIGGEAVEMLKARMSGKRIFLNAESPGPEKDVRSRRIGFYARHGLHPCGIVTEFAGTEWTVLCTGGLDKDEYTALMNIAGTPFRFLA